MVQWSEVHSQWSPNEKVALEVGLGASLGGARALVTMKHVGLNVAADPLFTSAYSGINGGLVVLVADDPGMHSSQDEQDSRHYARAAKAPMLEPSDSAEALQMAVLGFELSERFDTPLLLRSTTRVSHAKSPVTFGERVEIPLKPYVTDPTKYVMVPAHARERRKVLERRLAEMREYAETAPVNRTEWRDTRVGIITAGVSYQYAREAVPDASVLKLGLVFPLPERLIREFAGKVDRLYIVEELDPYLEEHVRALGIEVEGKSLLPVYGELDPGIVAAALGGEERLAPAPFAGPLPGRPPVMCPGCPHRAVFYTLRELGATVFGDIGCYTLGFSAPLSAMHSQLCMGAGIGMALGAEKAGHQGPKVAVIGDSTFVHSGITGLIDVVYNQGNTTVLILDNSTTAMTGRQEHPATGRTLTGTPTHVLDLEGLVRAVGVEDVRVVDAYEMDALDSAIRAAVGHPKPSVVIVRRACALVDRKSWKPALTVDPDACLACGACGTLGCPGILPAAEGEQAPSIDPTLCTGCRECAQICPFDAIG
jgi:indolepyruvate ferredoxin oxidoreductase alpha subunit